MVTEPEALAIFERIFPEAQVVPSVVPLRLFAEGVRVCDALGGTITLDSHEKVVVKIPGGVEPHLRGALGTHLDLLHHVALGRTGQPHSRLESGGSRHALGVCDVCREPCMVAVTRGRMRTGQWPLYRMTPGCEGRHVPVDRDLQLPHQRTNQQTKGKPQ